MFCKEHHLIHDSTVDWNVNGKKWGSLPNTDWPSPTIFFTIQYKLYMAVDLRKSDY